MALNASFLKANAKVSENIDDEPVQSVERSVQSEIEYLDQSGEYVIVEPLKVQKVVDDGVYRLIPYKNRRKKWGSSFQIGYGFYRPDNYEPNFSGFDYLTVYGDEDQPITEVQYIYKRNYSFFSLGLELGVGSSSASSLDTTTTLSMTPIRVGFRFAMDALFDEPLVVGYFSAGGYIINFSESQGASALDAGTAVSAYFTAGIQVQLNKLDIESSRVSYEEKGVENTYIFAEARQFVKSSIEQDRNFETDPFLNTGINIEF